METKAQKADRRRRTPSFQARVVARWNKLHMVGTPVRYYEVLTEEGKPDSEPLVTKTRTTAELLSGHTAVVWIEGKAGCVSVEHCFAIE